MNINPKEIIEHRLAAGMGLDQYDVIMKSVWETDVSSDADFQRVFNRFYRVRRNGFWRKEYYDLFEASKSGKPSFESVFLSLYERTGNLEASFSSKLIATLDPKMPLWDRYVIQNLNIKPEKVPGSIISAYAQIQEWYSEFLKTDNARECIKEFDRVLPKYDWISEIKKIDFFLWSIR